MNSVKVIIDDTWDLTVNLNNYAGCRTGAEPWIGELSVRPNVRAVDAARHDDWLDACRLSAARFFTSYGFVVGEAPRIDGEPEHRPDGTVRVRVTALVTVPPFWTGPPDVLGQLDLFGGDAA